MILNYRDMASALVAMLAFVTVIAAANWSYELIAVQCHVLIIADSVNASVVV